MWMVPERSLEPEWMDRPDNSAADLEATLQDIRNVNRLLGGRRVLLEALRPFLAAAPRGRPLEILDVGTGGADLPLAFVREAREAGCDVRVTAIDRDPETAAIAAREAAGHDEIRVVRCDARRPPFGAGSFDIVTASMFLHHFSHPEVVELLAGFVRLARQAVVINDLRRHRVPWAFIGLAARATRRHPMFVHDAPLSVLRGFTHAEMQRAASEAGAGPFRLERRWPYRLQLTLQTQ